MIGEGGMGQIFRARHAKLGTPAAVKVIRTERAADPGTVARFQREIRALGAVRHPGLVHALDADMERGRLYCAMEYVPGTDLERLIATTGPLAVETACRYAAQVADALQYISTLGLVHRDVKPANILVPADGGPVKLVDLGLARFELGAADSTAGLTRVGVMVGTPDYASRNRSGTRTRPISGATCTPSVARCTRCSRAGPRSPTGTPWTRCTII